MSIDSQGGDSYVREQFRMTRLQVFNWGTFEGIHDIPISERGFLFVGRSGAGKSTLLDAFSALLVPPRWIDFNAAAREADRAGRDRNLVSYMRGAWAEQKDGESGEIATRYLRPGTTWSALALTYGNELGQFVTLVRVLWLRGNCNGNGDVRTQFLIFERCCDLCELEEFGRSNFDVRKLKASFPEVFIREEFTPYRERFCRMLGIENEMALRLLHKTQSAKNLGDLNTFLRDFMLDKPETFAVADRLVSEFDELNAAHQSVVTARQQVQVLAPAREEHEHMQTLESERALLEELKLGQNSYRETLRMKLLGEFVAALEIQEEGLEGDVRRQQDLLEHQQLLLRELEHQHRDAGGDQIERWETDKAELGKQRSERLHKRAQAEGACQKLEWQLPETPQGFAELTGRARREVEQWHSGHDGLQDKIIALNVEKSQKEQERNEARKERDALRRQPSNIPARMLELRREIASAIGVSENALPFVGELLHVRQEDTEWQGAIERVLHGFALSLLVEERHYSALATYINGIDLGRRLVYHRTVPASAAQPNPVSSNSLFLKLQIKSGGHAEWLQGELRRHFDYACVDSIQAFRGAERAVTREGQVKHGKSRHEKDDRSSVDNRRNWVLGFDNREKLSLFERQVRDLEEAIAGLEEGINRHRREQAQRGARVIQCQTLVNLQWQEIDAASLLLRIEQIEQQLKEAREGNSALQELGLRIVEQADRVKGTTDGLSDVSGTLKSVRDKLEDNRRRLESLRQDPTIVPLTPYQEEKLDARYGAVRQDVRLDNLDPVDRRVAEGVNSELNELGSAIVACRNGIEQSFAEFIRQWRAEAGGLDATIAAAPDFFAKLVRLERDGLPDYEERFFDLLQKQSHQNLAALSTYLSDARKGILERMDLVNDSLNQVPFNQSASQCTYLHIEATDRQLPDVTEFKQQIKQALSHAWSEEREFAEERFLALRGLVERLGSQDADQKRWRESVLDVRQHVEFVGREIDEVGVEVEIYRSGAGKSGGQRQKLATTCLAAALRYQLGGNDHGVPIYAPVVLDEAFDKADNEFTALAMNIFTNFGFQMIVATPLKSVMTLEPFIGGACFVDISDRRVSGVLLIEYDDERQRLRLPEKGEEDER